VEKYRVYNTVTGALEVFDHRSRAGATVAIIEESIHDEIEV